jgi:hypothetical protein
MISSAQSNRAISNTDFVAGLSFAAEKILLSLAPQVF